MKSFYNETCFVQCPVKPLVLYPCQLGQVYGIAWWCWGHHNNCTQKSPWTNICIGLFTTALTRFCWRLIVFASVCKLCTEYIQLVPTHTFILIWIYMPHTIVAMLLIPYLNRDNINCKKVNYGKKKRVKDNENRFNVKIYDNVKTNVPKFVWQMLCIKACKEHLWFILCQA